MLFSKEFDGALPELKYASNCVICKGLLGPSTEMGGRTCMQWSCQQELARRKREGFGQRKCSYCHLPLSVHHYRDGVCSDSFCQAAQLRRNQREEALRKAELLRQKLASLAEGLGFSAETIHIMQIPANQRRILPLDDERKELFRQHLQLLFQEIEEEEAESAVQEDTELLDESTDDAREKDEETDAEDAVPAFLVAHSCRNCQGFCCTRGGDEAYLTADTIKRVQQNEPTLERDEIIQQYMDAIPNETNEGSCLFHGVQGCGLPASRRSDTCNNYFCGPLHGLLRQPPAAGVDVLSVATHHNEMIRVVRFNKDDFVPVGIPEGTEDK